MLLSRKPIIASILIAMLMMVNGLAFPKIVGHTFHHMHHTADTHTSPLCSWVCTAGQMDETVHANHSMAVRVIDTIYAVHPQLVQYFAYPPHNPRGPPIHL